MTHIDYIKLFVRIAGILIIFVLVVFHLFGTKYCNQQAGNNTEIITLRDTICIYDTIRIEKLIPAYIKTIDTFLVELKDTILIKDTVYLSIPKEEKIYQEESFKAWISGYRPSLDSIHIYNSTQQIYSSTTILPKSKSSKRWGIGIQTGYGLIYQQNTIKPAPYIGVGVSCHLLVF